jgi:hypothetical protein
MKIAISHRCLLFTAVLLATLFMSEAVEAQITAFTYQGKLIEAGNPVARSCR